jgi:hypothetical protein
MLGGIDNALFLTSFGGFMGVAILIVFLKWAFSSNKKMIVIPIKAGKKPLPTPGNYIEAEMALLKLQDSNIKVTLTKTLQGPSLMVFERDYDIALAVLKS